MNEDKPLKGLVDRGTVKFKCNDCEQDLLTLQLTSHGKDEKANVLTRVAVRCMLCGGYSQVQQVRGNFHAGAASDNMAYDILAHGPNDAPDADVWFEAWTK